MKKLILGIVIISSFVGLAAWLWTLQPTSKDNVLSEKNELPQEAQNASAFEPENYSVFKSASLTLKGKAVPNQIVAVSTGKTANILKTDDSGKFTTSLTLERGLNLVNITKFATDFKNSESTTLTYYVSTNSPATNIFAGSIKTIFDTLLTVTTANGEKSVRVGKSTIIDVPKEESEDAEATPSSALESIRIGDYAIALGNYQEDTKDTILSSQIYILRDNKPQTSYKVVFGKLLTSVKQNSISLESTKGESVSLTLDNDSDILLDGKPSEKNVLTAGKNAVIIYTQDEEDNLIKSIYLLP